MTDIPDTARRALGLGPTDASGGCYGRTAAGTPCVLPAGHYPASKHLLTFADGRTWFAWTDEAMADFARIACELANEQALAHEHEPPGHA